MFYRSISLPPIGGITLASDGTSLTGLWLEGQKYHPDIPAAAQAYLPVFRAAENWLRRYFAGERPDPREIPLAPQGSEFRILIWELLLEIPYGRTVTYGELAGRAAQRLGRSSMSAQAVGGAVGHNPISIIIPCHRVMGADGSLTGYAGGLDRKQMLLRLEGALSDPFCSAKKLPLAREPAD